ncbi:MAG: homoserine O-acetyltransferase [Pseudomonadota bacterium]
MGDARHYFHHKQEFATRRGDTLSEFTLAYETWGELNSARDNAVVIFTGLSPSAHAGSSPADPSPGWWEFMVGPGKPIDTRRWFVVCINSLGSCKGSTGPASTDPGTGKRYRLTFPALSIEDIAASGHLLVKHLQIDEVAVLVGPSMGGMTALAYALQFGRVRHMINVSSAASSSPFAIALRSLQREMIREDRHFQEGGYADGEGPKTGMRLARKLGMMTYRSAEEWHDRFKRDLIDPADRGDDPFGPSFAIESYLEYHAQKFIDGFDPNCYLYLSRAMDWFDAKEHCFGTAESRARFKSALVIGVHSDILFPIYQQRQIATIMTEEGTPVVFHALESIQGHDSFLVDTERFAPLVARYLENLT